MANIIEMPKLSDTMEEGGIAAWLKKEGDFVEEGEAFVEIETDKATMEYNSPFEGYLLKILVPAGKACQLNQAICVLGEKGETFDPSKLKSSKSELASASDSKKISDAVSEVVSSPVASQPTAPSAAAQQRLKASPLAKKIAHENQVDLGQISGSGPHGRVVVRDVEKAISLGVAGAPKLPAIGPLTPMPLPQVGDQDLPVSMMRKTIAKRLLTAKNEAPHFYLTRSADMSKFNEWRVRLNAEAEARNLPKVSVNDLLILALSRALIRHPEVNSSWQGETIRRYGAAHISVAVAVADGLITPVVRFANQLSAREIAIQTRELIQRAKNGQLKPEEYQGGTFSISNLGMMGIEQFTAIINPPQAAILAVGATIPTPWVGKNGLVEVQPRMTMTLSCDHRVIDGATGAEFLQTLVGFLEDPLMILA